MKYKIGMLLKMLLLIFDKVGRWWNNEAEIDIVAFDSIGNNIIFGECKYWEAKVGINVLINLEKKSNAVDWRKNERKNHYILFSINGFTNELIEHVKNRNDVLLWE